MFRNHPSPPSVCVQDTESYARKLSSPALSVLVHIKYNLKFGILSYKSQPRGLLNQRYSVFQRRSQGKSYHKRRTADAQIK